MVARTFPGFRHCALAQDIDLRAVLVFLELLKLLSEICIKPCYYGLQVLDLFFVLRYVVEISVSENELQPPQKIYRIEYAPCGIVDQELIFLSKAPIWFLSLSPTRFEIYDDLFENI